MPLDADAVARGCRGASVTTAHQLCRAELETFRSRRGGGPSRSAARRKRRCSRKSRRSARRSPSPTSARPPAGRRTRARPGRRSPRCSRSRPSRAAGAVREPRQRGRDPDLRPRRARDRGRRLLKDKLDVTVMLTPPAEIAPPRVTEFPVVKGTIRSAKGYLGAFELDGRRLCAAGALLARELSFGTGETARPRAATSSSTCPAARRCSRRTTCATATCAPIPAIRPPCCARC